MTTKTIEKKVSVLFREVANLRSLIAKSLATENVFEPDSFKAYKNSKTLQASFARGIKDWRAGRVQTKL